jgi:hypothetical protein
VSNKLPVSGCDLVDRLPTRKLAVYNLLPLLTQGDRQTGRQVGRSVDSGWTGGRTGTDRQVEGQAGRRTARQAGS